MKNFNFALLLSAYIFCVLWIFTKTHGIEYLIVYGFALSPIAVAAFALQGRKLRRREGELAGHAWLSLLASLVVSAALAVFVWHNGNFIWNSGATDKALHFFDNYTLGWTIPGVILVLAVSFVMGASAATIWTTYRFGETKSSFIRDVAPGVFFANVSEPVRFLTYLYMFMFSWSLGVACVSILWKGVALSALMMKLGRVCLPLAFMLVIALIRLPYMAAALVISCGGIWYLAYMNLDPAKACVFVGVPLAASLAYFAVLSIVSNNAKKQLKAAPESSVAAPGGGGEGRAE